jgi:hypothetical protein
MAQALWIGGPPGAGKTTLAARLARRHGLRLYSSDTRTWAHVDRGLAAGSEAARWWHEVPPHARWDAPPDELVTRAFHHERGPMVAEDVAQLPPAPLAVAEGTVLSPRLVDHERALWLLPSGRHGSGALYDALRAEIERETLEACVPVLRPGAIEDTVAAAEEHFAPALAEGPRAETPGERRALLREANEAVVEQVRGYFARPWTRGEADEVERAFLCECGDTLCTSDVLATVREAAAGALLARGHR